jgi:uncharacterized membrane protein
MLFATQSADLLSMSMSYVDLQHSPLVGVLLIVDLEKLVEGRLNRTFLVTMRDGSQMVARIPYTVTVPKYHAVTSEVATMALLRSSGLPNSRGIRIFACARQRGRNRVYLHGIHSRR